MTCKHTHRTERLVDKLGMMTEKPDGTVSAEILEWSRRCIGCGETVERGRDWRREDS